MCNLTDNDRHELLALVLAEQLSARDHIGMHRDDAYTTWLEIEHLPALAKLRRKLSAEDTVSKVRLSCATE